MSSPYGLLQLTSASDHFISLEHSSIFQWVSRLGFVTAATSLNGSQPNFARCLAVSWPGTLYIHLQRLLPQGFVSDIAIFVLKRDVKLQLTNSCPRAAIMLGIRPHSSSVLLLHGRLSWLPIYSWAHINISHCIVSYIPRRSKTETRMWANAQRDGHPAEDRWRPLFNAAKFGW